MDDLYAVLQIHPRAAPEVARAAYRALARLYHPDHGGDGREMIRLNEAWAVLGDPVRRSTYDAQHSTRAVTIDVMAATAGQVDHGSSQGSVPARSRHDQSTVLDFGRYAGWTLAQLTESDPDYLEWIIRTAIGRRLTTEVEELLGARAPGMAVTATGTPLASRRAR
jgi:curved DNA-binding protein CbpA